jgi:hypothetical protein
MKIGELGHKRRQRRNLIISLVVVMVSAVIILTAAPFSQAGVQFNVISPTDPKYPQIVDFDTTCFHVTTDSFDPIVMPGMMGMSHTHTFVGNLSINPNSTTASLDAGTTNCIQHGDKSSYWMPTVYANGVPLVPDKVVAYYRAGTTDGSSVNPIPHGLKIVAGNANATSAQSSDIVGYQCRNDAGQVVGKQITPPNCPSGSFLEPSVVFPNCWDGVNLDSADHKSHMAYGLFKAPWSCPVGYPVRIPRLTVAYKFALNATLDKTVTLASGSPLTLHADYMDAWNPSIMAGLVANCINISVHCGIIADDKMPNFSSATTTTIASTTTLVSTTTMPMTTTTAPVTTTTIPVTTTTVPVTTTTLAPLITLTCTTRDTASPMTLVCTKP